MSTKGFGEGQTPVKEEKTDEILQKVFLIFQVCNSDNSC